MRQRHRIVVPCVGERHAQRPLLDAGQKERRELLRGRAPVDEAVDLVDDRGDGQSPVGLGAQRRLDHRTQERGGHAFPRHVGDGEEVRAVLHGDEIVEISSHLAGRIGERVHVEVRHGRKLRRKEEDDHILVGLGGFAAEVERVAGEIGDGVEQGGLHVVVTEDDRVALHFQGVDLHGDLGFDAQFHVRDDLFEFDTHFVVHLLNFWIHSFPFCVYSEGCSQRRRYFDPGRILRD